MIYGQLKSGRKLHLVCQSGEEFKGEIIRAGYISAPICGQHWEGRYRMTVNMPLANACKKCLAAYERVYAPSEVVD